MMEDRIQEAMMSELQVGDFVVHETRPLKIAQIVSMSDEYAPGLRIMTVEWLHNAKLSGSKSFVISSCDWLRVLPAEPVNDYAVGY